MLESVKNRLTLLGYNVKDEDENTLIFSIDKAKNKILNLCNISKVPTEAKYIWVDMSASNFLTDKYANLESISETNIEKGIKSIKLGDVDVSYTDKNESDIKLEKTLNLLSKSQSDLVMFRRVKW